MGFRHLSHSFKQLIAQHRSTSGLSEDNSQKMQAAKERSHSEESNQLIIALFLPLHAFRIKVKASANLHSTL